MVLQTNQTEDINVTPNQREDMDRNLDAVKKFEPLNVVKRDSYDGFIAWGSWIVGVLAVVCAAIVFLHQMNLKVRP